MTQIDRILSLLRQRGEEGLTPFDALELAGSMRLAARIADLRALGHCIIADSTVTARGKRVAKYILRDTAQGRLWA